MTGAMNKFLIEFKAHSTRWNLYLLLLLGQKGVAKTGHEPWRRTCDYHSANGTLC